MERISGQGLEKKLLATYYIDAELKEMNYDHAKHLVTMKYTGHRKEEKEDRDYTILFKECFQVNFNTWLAEAEGNIPQSPNEQAFFFQDISIQDITLEGIQLYQCSLIIPMMDCQIICRSIEIV